MYFKTQIGGITYTFRALLQQRFDRAIVIKQDLPWGMASRQGIVVFSPVGRVLGWKYIFDGTFRPEYGAIVEIKAATVQVDNRDWGLSGKDYASQWMVTEYLSGNCVSEQKFSMMIEAVDFISSKGLAWRNLEVVQGTWIDKGIKKNG